MSDRHIVLDTGEVVDFTSPATQPDALRRAAAYLKRQATTPSRFAPEHDVDAPSQPNVSGLMTDYALEDPEVVEEREQTYRFLRARDEILRALDAQKQEAE